MLNFYHDGPVLDRNIEEIYSRCYSYYRINEDNLSDIYHLITKLDDFLLWFKRISYPLDRDACTLGEIEKHQNIVFYENGKPLLNIKAVNESLFFCSTIMSDVANLYPSLKESNLKIISSTLRGIFDEKYKQQTVKYYLNQGIELDILLSQLKETNSYKQLFFTAFVEATVDDNSNKINLSTRSDDVVSFSLKGIGSLLYDILSSIHHRSIYDFRNIKIRNADRISRKWITYPLNILFGFICIEILSLAFSLSQKYMDHVKLGDLAPSENSTSDLRWMIVELSLNYRNLTNLHGKILNNYKENLKKYIAELEIPFSLSIQ